MFNNYIHVHRIQDLLVTVTKEDANRFILIVEQFNN